MRFCSVSNTCKSQMCFSSRPRKAAKPGKQCHGRPQAQLHGLMAPALELTNRWRPWPWKNTPVKLMNNLLDPPLGPPDKSPQDWGPRLTFSMQHLLSVPPSPRHITLTSLSPPSSEGPSLASVTRFLSSCHLRLTSSPSVTFWINFLLQFEFWLWILS